MVNISKEIADEIIINNVNNERKTLSPYACKSIKAQRRYPEREIIPDRINIRPAYFHDTDRIIHSKAYTRYIDKTQVFYLFENDHITHRVLHVQFVSKIARVIGRCLKLNEDLIEAISLGHDIGHVPYGHNGEKYLNLICEKLNIGYFIHNAQSVRDLMELENSGKGINLTLQVLDGILCHNGELLKKVYEPDYNKDWDQFLDEYNKCWTIKNYDKRIISMSLEGCVMRISDVIAYIGRDIEDAITINLIKRNDIPEEITNVLGNTNDQIINNLIIDVINNSYNKKYIRFSDEVFSALCKLLQFNNNNIYANPKKASQDEKIQSMFQYLFNMYLNDLKTKNSNSSIFQYFYNNVDENYIQSNSLEKVVIDYIAGMTDHFFNNEFKKQILPQSFGMHIK